MRTIQLSPGVRHMAAGAFFFSVMSLLVKLVGARLPSQEIVLARATITAALSWWGIHRAGVSPWGNRPRLLLVRGIVGFIGLSGFYYSVVHLPLADATVIQYTNPVFAALLAVPLLGERIHRREAWSIAAGMVGVVFVTRPALLFGGAAAFPTDAVLLGLMGAVGSAAAYVTVRRLGTSEHALVVVFYFAIVSVVASLPLGLAGAVMPTPLECLILGGVGVTTQLGQVHITKGLRLERAGRATAVGYLQIVFAAAFGIAFFGERLAWTTLAGAALIVGGTLALGAAKAPAAEADAAGGDAAEDRQAPGSR